MCVYNAVALFNDLGFLPSFTSVTRKSAFVSSESRLGGTNFGVIEEEVLIALDWFEVVGICECEEMEGPFKWWLWLCDEAGKIVIFSQFKMN
jgi:Fe2+ or Zn2+ uptake regulation protein